MSRARGRWIGAAAFAASTLLAASVAHAAQVEIVAVMWQEDLSARSTVEEFFGCLVDSSTFGTSWANQFGLTKVTWKGVYVLSDPCPRSAHLAGNLHTLLTAAFDGGKLPKPSPDGTSYLLYLPRGVQGYDDQQVPACQRTYCGVHGTTSYHGTLYDAALVPIECADCGSVQITLIGEHEAAEAIANFGTARYEVGDACEGASHETQLACCGKQYPIQQLSSSRAMSDCQTINATGNLCGCTPSHLSCAQPSGCCAGLSCAAVQEQPGGTFCCAPSGGTCATRADCCGSLQCSGGKCACVADGQRCLGNADCCGGRCDGASGTCGAPPPPIDLAVANPDAGSGSADGSGSGGGSGGSGGSGSGGNGAHGGKSGGCSIRPRDDAGPGLGETLRTRSANSVVTMTIAAAIAMRHETREPSSLVETSRALA